MHKAIAIFAALILSACSTAPYSFPDTGRRLNLTPINETRIVVKKEFRYLPSLTALVLPAGEYLPVRADAGGTFYESPRGILILPVTGTGYVVRGGIYRGNDTTANYQFSVYGSFVTQPLHSMWGLDLNEMIACTPKCAF